MIAYIFLEIILQNYTKFFSKMLVSGLVFVPCPPPPRLLLACLKITLCFEQKACKYPYKIGFPFYTADLRINVRCKLFNSKCIPRTKKDVFKNYNEIISAENVSTIVFIFNKLLNTEMSCSHINVKFRLAKMLNPQILCFYIFIMIASILKQKNLFEIVVSI